MLTVFKHLGTLLPIAVLALVQVVRMSDAARKGLYTLPAWTGQEKAV